MSDGKRYLFYDTTTGEILINEARNRLDIMPSVERIVEIYPKLHERNPESFSFIELEYGEYRQEFMECDGYRVNPETKELEFIHVDEETPVEEGEPGVPLTDQIEALEAQYMYDSMMKDLEIDSLSAGQAELMYQLMMKGVL